MFFFFNVDSKIVKKNVMDNGVNKQTVKQNQTRLEELEKTAKSKDEQIFDLFKQNCEQAKLLLEYMQEKKNAVAQAELMTTE